VSIRAGSRETDRQETSEKPPPSSISISISISFFLLYMSIQLVGKVAWTAMTQPVKVRPSVITSEIIVATRVGRSVEMRWDVM